MSVQSTTVIIRLMTHFKYDLKSQFVDQCNLNVHLVTTLYEGNTDSTSKFDE